MTKSRKATMRGMIGALVGVLAMGLAMPSHAKDIAFDDATIAELDADFASGALTSERLVQMCLDRIQAYDHQGPKLNALLFVNPKALDQARALDAERKAGKVRGPLHGIPVILKDNYDTFDMPTTGGSVLLEGSIPKKDAFVVARLRAAGAIILAKANMSEFASGGSFSSMAGTALNPHDLTRTPSGSSSGTGSAIAAGYAPLGTGSDTGGSIRGPAAVSGVAGLKPTLGLVSRNGIIPLALSFDTGGPLARNVSDIAAVLGAMTGVDPGDAATKGSEGKFPADYTKFLKTDALKGARIGVARDFMGQDSGVDWVIEAGLAQMRKAGATIVDVRFPKWMLDSRVEFYRAIRYPEFAKQIKDYLANTGPKYPKSITDLIERSDQFVAPRGDGTIPNPSRWALFKLEAASGTTEDYQYTSVHDHALPLVRSLIEGAITAQKLDAIVYPTDSKRPALLDAPPDAPGGGGSAILLANLSGFPDLSVPAGFTEDSLPVDMSFMGTAYSEPKLLALGYSFEQMAHARRRPIHTPALSGAVVPAP